MKKLLSCLVVLFLMSFSLFAKEQLLNLGFIFPITFDGSYRDKNFSWGLGADVRYMQNDVWGLNAGGYFSLTEDKSTKKNSYFDVVLYGGFPVRIFKTKEFDAYIIPQAGIDLFTNYLFKSKNDEIDTVTSFFFGVNTELDYKVSQYLYFYGGLAFDYYFFSSKDGVGETTGSWFFNPSLGMTLVL